MPFRSDDEPQDPASGQNWTNTEDDENAWQDYVKGEIEEDSTDLADDEIEKAK